MADDQSKELPWRKMSPAQLEKAIAMALSETRTPTYPSSQQYRKLELIYQDFLSREQFQPGDIIQWKSGLKNRKIPEYGQAAVVIHVYDEPLIAVTDDTSSQYFMEPLTIIAGLMNEENSVVFFHFDGRRFERIDTSLY